MPHAKKQTSGKWSLRKDIFTLFFAVRDNETPVLPKVVSFLSLAYLISPVDFLPDVVPFAGYLDDLVVVPLLLRLSNVLLPEGVKIRSAAKAVRHNRKLNIMLVVFILFLVVLMGWLMYLLFYRH
jgi:uncharacterized membrane protein YkvA (DUF1232 family)